MRKRGFHVLQQLTVGKDRSHFKADHFIASRDNVLVIDVAVTAGQNVEQMWVQKMEKWNTAEVNHQLLALIKSGQELLRGIKYLPLTSTECGYLYRRSTDSLRMLGITPRDISDVYLF